MSRPTVPAILRLLADAGSDGEFAGVIARAFTEPAKPNRCHVMVNTMLGNLLRQGMVSKSSEKVKSPLYHKVPGYVWYITPAGRSYLAAGCRDGITERVMARMAEMYDRQAEVQARQEHARTVAPSIVAKLRPGCHRDRVAFIVSMRAVPLTLNEIGIFLGVSRERIRQMEVMNATGNITCRCDSCAAGITELSMAARTAAALFTTHARP